MKPSFALFGLVLAGMIAGGWAAYGIKADRARTLEVHRQAITDACSHDRARAAGLTSYLPVARPQPASQTTFMDARGNGIRLADFRGTGVVLNFWATWCVPCVAEMPALDRLDANLADEGIRVVAVSEDRKPLEVSPPFYEKHGLLSMGIYADNTMALARNMNVAGLPTTSLINRAGEEVAAVLGPAEWDQLDIADFLRRCLRAGEPGE